MMNRDEFMEVLRHAIENENKNLIEDGVENDFRLGAKFGMNFMLNIVSDCLNGNVDIVREVYSD